MLGVWKYSTGVWLFSTTAARGGCAETDFLRFQSAGTEEVRGNRADFAKMALSLQHGLRSLRITLYNKHKI